MEFRRLKDQETDFQLPSLSPALLPISRDDLDLAVKLS